MTEPPSLPPEVLRRLADHRRRRAAPAADRAAFAERRRRGLKARHAATLAYVAERQSERDQQQNEPSKEEPTPDTQHPNAA
ncbi:hypothetical protein [Actinophytocola sediminis]